MNNDAFRGVECDRRRLWNRVAHGYEHEAERSVIDPFTPRNGPEVGLDAQFVHTPTRQFHRQLSPVYRNLDVSEEVGQRAHMVFVAVCDDHALDVLPPLGKP